MIEQGSAQTCGIGCCPTPNRQTHIMEAMSRLDTATATISKLVDDFILRVNGILREEPPTVKCDGEQALQPISATPLAYTIQMQTDRLIGICATLRGVIDRVEL